jgi:phage shock protein C
MTEMPPVPQQYKQLRRSRSDRMFAGVCGGLAHYFNIDPVAARVAFGVLTIITGGALVLGYLVAWIVMPEETPAPAAPAGYPGYPTTPAG